MPTLIPFTYRSNLARKAPDVDPFAMLRGEMDRVFDNFFSIVPASDATAPLSDVRLNVSDTGDAIEVKAELPGVTEKDVEVSLHGDILTLKGEKKAEKEEKDKNYYVREFSYGSFARSIKLPFEADESKVDARFEKGVLTVTLPKPKEEAKSAKRITIKNA